MGNNGISQVSAVYCCINTNINVLYKINCNFLVFTSVVRCTLYVVLHVCSTGYRLQATATGSSSRQYTRVVVCTVLEMRSFNFNINLSRPPRDAT
jgi:hypothetical protein